MSFDWNEKKVMGEVETRILPLADNFREFEVDAVGFNSVSVRDEKDIDPKFDYDGKKIKIYPVEDHSASDTIVYTVNYTCQPQRGLYFIYPTDLDPSMPFQIWTQGGQEDNRYWIPVYDYPNDKTTFEVYVTVDEKFKTLSNGYLENSKVLSASNQRQDHWVMHKPNSTYLIMLAAGEFEITEESYNTLPVQFYTDRNILKSESDYTLRNTPEMIQVLERRFGYKYPWNKYAQVVVENFLYGGMENTSATVLNRNVIYNREAEKDYSSDALIAHELGHQWFGDLVTCSNWSDLWLNESFGEYSTSLWKEHYFGKDEYDYEIYLNGEKSIGAEITNGRYPVWAGYGLVNENIYQKGSVILNTFRHVLGDSVFFRSMKNFLNKYEYKNIVADDLINVINETYSSANKSNTDYRWMFDQWIRKAGYPEFKVRYDYDEDSKQLVMYVRQLQTTDSLTPVFRMPIDVRLKTVLEDRIERIEINDNDEIFYFNLSSKPELVVFDYGNKILDITGYNKSFEEWKAQFELSGSAIDRIMALKGAELFLKEDTTETAGKPEINSVQSEALKLFKIALETDKFWGVRAEAAKILSQNFISDRTSMVLKDSYDAQTDPRIKREILITFGDSKRSEDIAFIKAKIQNEKNDYIVAEGIRSLGKTLPAEEIFDAVNIFSGRTSHRNVIQYAVIESLDSASGKSEDVRIKNTIMNFAFGKDVEGVLRAKAIIALRKYAKDEDVKNLALKYADFNFMVVKSSLILLLSLSRDKSVIPFLVNMNNRTTDESMSRLISSSIKRLEKSN
ncbi:MAG: M1 family metallopeptidase [Ignavibacteria bacterium]|nr:M1 family metallopeptidase [Ignavibacteria bacterium]